MPYRPLIKGSRAIRLLILSPELHPLDNRIQCRLFVTSLNDYPSYDALSYTWGEPDNFNFRIWVNGKLVPVRQNLLCALRVLRKNVERVLWIDALCINQADEQERGHQVEMMGDIYRMAHWVLAWLGTPDQTELQDRRIDIAGRTPKEVSVPAFDFLEAASKRSENRFLFGFNQFDWMIDFVHNREFDEHWKQLAEICDLDYWKRVWIIQEICLALNLRVIYGTRSVDWRAFRNVNSVVSMYPLNRRDGSHLRIPDVNYAYKERVKRSQAWKLVKYMLDEPSASPNVATLRSLLELSTPCSCLDRKDKVYGILGLASDVPVGAIPVDYSQSLFQLYTSVIRFKLQHAPKHGVDALLVPFSQLLQQTLLGPGPEFEKLGVMDLIGGRYEMILRPPLRENFIQTAGWIVGKVVATSENPEELWKRVQRLSRKRGQFKSACFSDQARKICKAWKGAMDGIWNTDHDTFALFLQCFYGRGRTATSLLTREEFSAGLTMFLTDEMAIGIGPKGITPGDKIWKFHGDRFHAIIRGQEEHFKVLGRAVVAEDKMLWDEVSNGFEFPHPVLEGRTYHLGKAEEIKIDIDIAVLQALTCPLRWEGFRRVGE